MINTRRAIVGLDASIVASLKINGIGISGLGSSIKLTIKRLSNGDWWTGGSWGSKTELAMTERDASNLPGDYYYGFIVPAIDTYIYHIYIPSGDYQFDEYEYLVAEEARPTLSQIEASTIISKGPRVSVCSVQNSETGDHLVYATTVMADGVAAYADAPPTIKIFEMDSQTVMRQSTMSKILVEAGLYFYKLAVNNSMTPGRQYLILVTAVIGAITVKSATTIKFAKNGKLNYLYNEGTQGRNQK